MIVTATGADVEAFADTLRATDAWALRNAWAKYCHARDELIELWHGAAGDVRQVDPPPIEPLPNLDVPLETSEREAESFTLDTIRNP